MVFFHSYVCLPEGNFQNGGDLGTWVRHLIRYMGMSFFSHVKTYDRLFIVFFFININRKMDQSAKM